MIKKIFTNYFIPTLLVISSFLLLTKCQPKLQSEQVTVWDGEQMNQGNGWVTTNGVCTVNSQTTVAHSGESAVQFTFNSMTVESEADWVGAGWNWVNWQVGPYGTDITAMKNFTF